jgi:hypothetical protein
MTVTYDLSTDVGRVRLLIPDRVLTDAVYEDDEITVFLSLEGDSVPRAAALALETIAADTAATLRVTRVLGFLDVDGAKAADSLMKRAKELRAQAAASEVTTGDLFDWANMVYPGDANSAYEQLRAARLSSGL